MNRGEIRTRQWSSLSFWTLRSRYTLLVGWSAGWLLWSFARTRGHLTDWYFFVYGGRALFGTMPGYHAGALHLYAQQPGLQIGPPALAVAGLITQIFGRAGDLVAAILMLIAGLGIVGSCEAIARRSGTAVERRAIATGTLLGGVALMAPWSVAAGTSQHLDDAGALLCITLAALVVVKRRPWWVVALLVGSAIASKPWAIVATPIILGLARQRWLRTTLGTAFVAAMWWLPFIAGDHRTISALGGFVVPVDRHSVLHLLGVGTYVSPHWVRPAQLYLGVVVASFASLQSGWLAAPLAGISVRILFDPQVVFYYGIGPMAAALLWDLGGRRRRVPVLTCLIGLAEYLIPWVAPSLGSYSRLCWVAGVLLLLLSGRSRAQIPQGEVVGGLIQPCLSELPTRPVT